MVKELCRYIRAVGPGKDVGETPRLDLGLVFPLRLLRHDGDVSGGLSGRARRAAWRIWLAGQKQQGLVVNCRGQVVGRSLT